MHLWGGRGNEDEDREEGIGRRTGEQKYGRAKRIQHHNTNSKANKSKGEWRSLTEWNWYEQALHHSQMHVIVR